MIIRLTKEQILLIIEDARKKYPLENCGILFGDINSTEAVVRKIVVTHNILESSTNFQIDPEEFLKALLGAEKESMQLIGFFHSHPAKPQPSKIDLQYMKFWPESIGLIISSIDYNIAAYQTINNKFRRIIMKVK